MPMQMQMPDKSKLIPIILILVSLSFAGVGFYLLQKEKVINFNLQQESEALKAKLFTAEKKLDEYQKTIAQLQGKLTEAQTNIDTLTASLDQEKKLKDEAMGQVQQLKTDLEKQKKFRADLEGQLSQTQKDAKKTQDLLKDLEAKKSALDIKLKDLESQVKQMQDKLPPGEAQGQGVELGTIVVGPETQASAKQGAAAPPVKQPKGKEAVKVAVPLEGKVLVVNKDYNFVVIDLGTKDGIAPNSVFGLYHNNKYVGDIKVEKIRENMSAANFETPSLKDVVSEGDRVVQKTK